MNERLSEDALEEIRALRAALRDEPTFAKWNYNDYCMIRGVHTGHVVADVFDAAYAPFYDAAPADITALLAEVDALRGERDLARAMLTRAVRIANSMEAALFLENVNGISEDRRQLEALKLDIARITQGTQHDGE